MWILYWCQACDFGVSNLDELKPKIPKYVEYLGTKKQPPHTLQLTHPRKKHIQQSTQKTQQTYSYSYGDFHWP